MNKEEILSEFELYFRQLLPMLLQTSGQDKQEGLKANLANLAHEYSAIRQDRQRYPLGKERMKALRELWENEDIVITRPDKGSGTVLLNTADYISKTMAILGDKSKFKFLGSCDGHDRTGENDCALHAFLLRERNSGKISKDVYERIRPTGSVRSRMYGLPKVHKPEPIPLRPILSLVGSAQHELARWLAEVVHAQPVLARYSSNVIKDSFGFCADLQEFGHVDKDAFMCSFNVVSLFTNVLVDETVGICLDTLYRSDLKPPKIKEDLLKKLRMKATRDV